MEEEKIYKILERILVDDIKEECIGLITEEEIDHIIQFLKTGERRKSKLVDCLGGYDAIRRLSELL
ncbi:hypothetical protein AVT97_gp38 [Sulfolobales Virus YNP2]|uniref:hypothetical protein n=1 Tax=Sulfolobales Virus YNP2 TaxID=1732180 RepID=UPI000706B856|nr:hypothetical protein AVT97_gp38 [Sulfolobales Virus YNP2]ALG97201.1 hypothetical protein [Sulfolobales Virus YNP2]